MACYNFSFDEIREQLAVLGYTDVSDAKVAEFKRDLDGISMVKSNARSQARFAPEEEEEEGEEEEDEETYVSSTFTPTAEPHSGRRVRIVTPRRTVLRKVVRRDEESQQRRVEETSYTEEVSALGSNESLHDSSWSPPPRAYHHHHHVPPISGHGHGHGLLTRTRRPLSARSSSSIQTDTSSVSAPCGGLIVRSAGQPHTRNLKRGDPVSRYHAYKQLWDLQRPPGDLNHRQLRWTVKEAMMVHEVPLKRPPKQKANNDYVPPTDKPRKDLRWRIRQEMAKYQVPTKSAAERIF